MFNGFFKHSQKQGTTIGENDLMHFASTTAWNVDFGGFCALGDICGGGISTTCLGIWPDILWLFQTLTKAKNKCWLQVWNLCHLCLSPKCNVLEEIAQFCWLFPTIQAIVEKSNVVLDGLIRVLEK